MIGSWIGRSEPTSARPQAVQSIAAAIVLGKNFAVKQGSPRRQAAFGVKPELLDCFVTV
jgi:hypothetical protein